ncbi:MAG TPA: hypothetical protein VFR37_02230 [Longimicrobium sp.]|nr:hypothetical protein [Longimicrobium sp.]
MEITGYSPHTIYYYTSSRVDAAEQIPHTKRRRFLVFNEAEVKEWQARKDGLVPDVVEEPAMLAGASHG